MMKAVRASFLIVGVVSIICAALGILYNISTFATGLSGAFEPMVEKEGLTHFYSSFYIMSGLCVVCYVLLILCGVDLVRQKGRFVWLFVSALVFELVYFFSIGFFLWPMPELGHSVAAATGIANGGLTFQFIILFPIWGGILAFWAERKSQITL